MSSTLTLPPRCTLVQAEELACACRSALQTALDTGGAGLQIDASAVEEADVSLVQILIATRKSCEARGHEFSLTPSPVLDTLARRAGLRVTHAGLDPGCG